MFLTFRVVRFFSGMCSLVLLGACSGDGDLPPDCAVEGPSIAIASSINPTCTSLGSIEVASSGGEQPVAFSINGVDFRASALFADLEPGTYVLTAKDANDCTATSSVSLTLQNDLVVTYTATAAGCGGAEGSIEIGAEGGSGSYLFSVDGENFVESSGFSGLPHGIYTIAVRDGQCEQEVSAIVPSGISFDALVAPIITSKCATEDCHGGRQAPDFRVFANLKGSAAQVGIYVEQGVMPPAAEGVETLTEEETATILCWVADGAPAN